MKKFKESRTSPRQIYRTVNGLKNDLQHESTEDLKVLVDQTLFQFGLKYDGDIYRKLNTGDEYPYHVWKALPTQNLTQRWLIGIWPGFDGYDYQFRIYAADTLDQIKNNEVGPLAEYEGTNSIDELISDLEDAFKYFINEDFKEFQKYPQEVWDQMVKEGRVDENGNLRDETFELIVDENDPICDQFHICSRGDFDAYMASLDHPLDESEKMRGEKMRFLMNGYGMDPVDIPVKSEEEAVDRFFILSDKYLDGRSSNELYSVILKDDGSMLNISHNGTVDPMEDFCSKWISRESPFAQEIIKLGYKGPFKGETITENRKGLKEDENVELKVGDIVDIKEFREYDRQAKVTEIGKIRGGYFAGRPFVSAYQSWGKDHAPGSTSGHNFCFMRSSHSGEWIDLKNDTLLDSRYWSYLDNLFGYNKKESSRKSKKSIKEEAQESVSGLKWYQRGDTFKQNWGDNFIDAKAVDAELDAIVAANGGNEFQIKDPKIKKPLSFKIKGWYNFNGDNVEVELIFNREFEDGFDKEKWGTMHGDMASCESHYVEDWLNEHLADFGFEDYEITSNGWDNDTHTPTKGIHWYKYSMKNKDNTHKMPNLDDWSTGNSNLNGTEPFTKEEGKEIDKEVANCIAELMKANPKGVYGRDVTATPEDMENLIIKVRPTGVTWRGSYTHNYGYFAFEIDVKDYYDSEKENWRGQKGTTWGASEDDITSLLRREAAGALNDFLYEFNLEIVPDNCKAEWYHGSREDVTYLEFDVYFKEIGIDPYKSYKAHSGNSFKDYWDGSEPKDLYKGKTFKRNPKRVKESKNLKERVLDYDTWDKYYDEGAEAYFEGKSLDEVPITGNAWFREAWEMGWKDSKAIDDEEAERAEAAYEEEAYWE